MYTTFACTTFLFEYNLNLQRYFNDTFSAVINIYDSKTLSTLPDAKKDQSKDLPISETYQ